MREILLLARGVDDEEQPVDAACHHQIVEDAAALVGELRVAHAVVAEAFDVGRDQRLERRLHIGTAQHGLAHMRDVEQRRFGAALLMLFDDSRWILHRHVVAGERHHARAERLMEGVERRGLEGALG